MVRYIVKYNNADHHNKLIQGLVDIIVSYHCVISRIIDGDNRDSISGHIKAYLTKLHKLDKLQKVPGDTCVLVKKVKFLILLNILDAIEQVGVSQSVREGGDMGEGYIPNLKQRFTKWSQSLQGMLWNHIMKIKQLFLSLKNLFAILKMIPKRSLLTWQKFCQYWKSFSKTS